MPGIVIVELPIGIVLFGNIIIVELSVMPLLVVFALSEVE